MNTPTPAPSAGELLTVTQADREAAIAYINTGAPPLPDSIIGFRDDIQSGEGDHYQIVQAFARHRIEHAAPSPGADIGGAFVEPFDGASPVSVMREEHWRTQRNDLFEALKAAYGWMGAVADCDMGEIVADGGITAAMVVRQEAAEQARRARRSIDAAIVAYKTALAAVTQTMNASAERFQPMTTTTPKGPEVMPAKQRKALIERLRSAAGNGEGIIFDAHHSTLTACANMLEHDERLILRLIKDAEEEKERADATPSPNTEEMRGDVGRDPTKDWQEIASTRAPWSDDDLVLIRRGTVMAAAYLARKAGADNVRAELHVSAHSDCLPTNMLRQARRLFEIAQSRKPAALSTLPATMSGGEAEKVAPGHRRAGKRDWVDCPICGETDMRWEEEPDAPGQGYIQCVNLSCPSNALTAYRGEGK